MNFTNNRLTKIYEFLSWGTKVHRQVHNHVSQSFYSQNLNNQLILPIQCNLWVTLYMSHFFEQNINKQSCKGLVCKLDHTCLDQGSHFSCRTFLSKISINVQLGQICVTLCNFGHICATLSDFVWMFATLRNFEQICATLCNFEQICAILCELGQLGELGRQTQKLGELDKWGNWASGRIRGIGQI